MSIMDIKINTKRQKDVEDMSDAQKSNKIKVINTSKDTEYAGIKPGETGEIDVAKWGPYEFALKKVKPEKAKPEKVEAKKVEAKPTHSSKTNKPKKTTNKIILLKAFTEAANGSARAALMLGVQRQTLVRWLAAKRTPNTKTSTVPVTFDSLLEHLDQSEQPIFKQKVVELCQAQSKKKKTSK